MSGTHERTHEAAAQRSTADSENRIVPATPSSSFRNGRLSR